MAPSLASAPELPKNTLSMPVRLHSFLASLASGAVTYRLLICCRAPACAATAAVQAGWQNPSELTPMPEVKSRYAFPSAS